MLNCFIILLFFLFLVGEDDEANMETWSLKFETLEVGSLELETRLGIVLVFFFNIVIYKALYA